MIEQISRKSYFKPIPPNKELEAMDKNTVYYRRKQNRLRCLLCANTATKMLVQELEGYKRVERYCDLCTLKVQIT